MASLSQRPLKFVGCEEMTLDTKGRVAIPTRHMAILKAICPDEADCMGIMISPDRSIRLMPAPYYREEIERLFSLDDRFHEERLVKTVSVAHSDLLILDKQNRISLGSMIMRTCKLTKDVVIVGSGNYMQLFDLDVWTAYMDQAMPQLGVMTESIAARSLSTKASVDIQEDELLKDGEK